MSFKIESDAAFAVEVNKDRASALKFPGLSGSGSRRDPWLSDAMARDVLLAAGRASAAISDPARAVFEISSWWAVVRWFWAFDHADSEVQLSPEGRRVRHHHRQALSESIGLGVGLLLAEEFVSGGFAHPQVTQLPGPILIDVDSIALGGGSRPDLIVLPLPMGSAVPVVLECKGTCGGRFHSIAQLRRGIEQVDEVAGRADRIVVGSRAANGSPLHVHAIAVNTPAVTATPAEPGDETNGPDHSDGCNGDDHTPGGPDDPTERGDALDGEPADEKLTIDALTRDALDAERDRIVRFSGGDMPTEEARRTIVLEPGLTVLGTQVTLNGASVRLTVGVEQTLYERTLEAESPDALFEARWDYLARMSPLMDTVAFEPSVRARKYAFGPDGCILVVESLDDAGGSGEAPGK